MAKELGKRELMKVRIIDNLILIIFLIWFVGSLSIGIFFTEIDSTITMIAIGQYFFVLGMIAMKEIGTSIIVLLFLLLVDL